MVVERDHGGRPSVTERPVTVTTDSETDELVEAATGWRIWHVNIGDDPPALHPPDGGAPGCVGTQPVTSQTIQAQCIFRPDHHPPERDCSCGLYAVENVIDALYRLHVITANIATGTTSFWHSYTRTAPLVPVLARVHLTRVRWIKRAVAWSDLKCITPEMRATTARIECLYVSDELIGHDHARHLADRLSTALDIRAIVGYPTYTLDDWEQRPDWYRHGGPHGLLDDEYEPLPAGDNPYVIPFAAPIPAPGETVWGGHVCR